jgi:hypothetical protein
MARCEVCGNEYDIHCGCRILGHGIEAHGKLFCCAHCARPSGESAARDRV